MTLSQEKKATFNCIELHRLLIAVMMFTISFHRHRYQNLKYLLYQTLSRGNPKVVNFVKTGHLTLCTKTSTFSKNS
eukprot:UN25373